MQQAQHSTASTAQVFAAQLQALDGDSGVEAGLGSLDAGLFPAFSLSLSLDSGLWTLECLECLESGGRKGGSGLQAGWHGYGRQGRKGREQ